MSDPAPLDPSAPRARGTLFWLAIVGAAGLLCCGGIGAAVWFGGQDWIKIVTAPESERLDLLSKKLEALAGDRLRVADDFLAAVDAGRIDDAWNLTSASFRSATQREQFDQLARSIPAVMGPLQSRRLINLNSRNVVGSAGATTLILQGTFEKGAGTITLEIDDSAAPFTVQRWHTASPLFLEAMNRGASPSEK